MPSATGQNWEQYQKKFADDEVEEKKITPLSDEDIQVLKTYGAAPYAAALKKLEKEIKDKQTSVNEKIGVKESDTGLAPPHLWDIAADRQRMQEEQPLQVARCTKIIPDERDSDKSKYVINVKQIAKFVVNLGERVSPTDIEEGMRVGVDRNKYQIMLPLPPKTQLPHAAFRPPKRYPQPPSNRHQQQRVPRLAHPHATANPTQEQLAIAATIKEWTAGDNLIPAHPRNALHRNDQSSIETKESGPCEDVANVLSQALPPLLAPVAPSVATSRHPSRAGRKLGGTRRMRGSSKGKDEDVRGSNRTGVGISAQSNDTRLRKQGGYVMQPKRRPEPQSKRIKGQEGSQSGSEFFALSRLR